GCSDRDNVPMAKPIIFRCPSTSENVQHLLEDDDADDEDYEAVECLACAKIHFINKATGKLLGEK
ncbi:hypothetical protein ABTO04_19560, partial [Acinetobacter baumannii]